MTKAASPCPICQAAKVWIVNDNAGLYLECDCCKARGPVCPASQEAREAWQQWREDELRNQAEEAQQ